VKIVVRDGSDIPDLGPVVARDKITVVDFSATWCEPCRKLDEHMNAIVAKRSDVAYRKLDVADWDSPLAQHYLRKVTALPYVMVFDKRGAKTAEISGLDVKRLDDAIAGAALR
jgi:thiol-disulfide isomerase/thioredoxin